LSSGTESPANKEQSSDTPPDAAFTAAVLIIGNEILSGRTHDTNLPAIADALGQRGIAVGEARVIPDDATTIQETLNTLRAAHDFVFTTGGIGPTHDDITAENVAAAFGVPLITHPEAKKRLLDYFEGRGVEPNEARMRMARTPEGATLVDNPVSVAPGFQIGNVYVMAGVPKIMQAMLANILPGLPLASELLSQSVVCDLPEGTLAAPLGELQRSHPDVDLGSYPGKTGESFRVSLVVRGRDRDRVEEVAQLLEAMIAELGGNIIA